ncbi:YceI family protein [uncultured Caballeronia sp.]|uniref:YceI family protein n=1 Tax=uncultured Caballeronia sp. TaxID=1827198 RepID=UPI001575C2AA
MQSRFLSSFHTIRAGLLVAGLLSLPACTALSVVTHSVSPNETSVPAGRYKLDEHHWNVSFDVDHFKYSRFVMRFDKVDAQLNWSAGGMEQSTVEATIDADSLDTNVPILNKMIKGNDVLNVDTYPTIHFVSTQFKRTGDQKGELTGDLTIRGTTRPVTLAVTFNGHAKDPLTKKETLGFSADGHFSRAQFGLSTWYPAVGDDVHVAIQAEFDADGQ